MGRGVGDMKKHTSQKYNVRKRSDEEVERGIEYTPPEALNTSGTCIRYW